MHDDLTDTSRHLVDLLTELLSTTFRQILWKQALELDLNYSQAQVLFHVAKHGGALMSDVARSFGITLSAVTQVTDRLESKAFLRRGGDPLDRRHVRLVLTPKGERLARKLEQLQVEGLARVLQRLTPADRKDVIRGLERLLAAARGDDPSEGGDAPTQAFGPGTRMPPPRGARAKPALEQRRA